MESILYDGTTAAWCKGGCGKFRYPYCLQCDRPICATCALFLGLKPIKSNWVSKGSESFIQKRQKRISQKYARAQIIRQLRFSLPFYQLQVVGFAYQLLILNRLWLKNIFTFLNPKKVKISQKEQFADSTWRLLQALQANPKSATMLKKEIHLTAYSFLKISKSLLENGLIIAKKERSSRGIYWYALPDQKSRLDALIGTCLQKLILEQLAIAPMTAQQLSCLIPDYELNWISNLLGKMTDRGELISKGANKRRMYALPLQLTNVDWDQFDPINTAIIDLLKYCPYLWVREIARRLDKAPKTVSNRLTQLEKLKLVSASSQGKQKLYVVKG